MFSDIEGSTRLFHELGDDYPRWFARHQDIVRAAVARHNGHEVKTEGDRFFVAFASARDAVAAAVEMQRDLAAEAWPERNEIRVRVGLHTGPAEPVDGDYISLTVHRAAASMSRTLSVLFPEDPGQQATYGGLQAATGAGAAMRAAYK